MHQRDQHARRRRAGARIGALTLAIGLTTGGGAFAAQPPAQPPTGPPTRGAGATGAAGGSPDTVTLLTGDQVRVEHLPAGREAITVKPGPGRDRMTFLQRRVDDSVSVVPADALALLNQGALDRRLFDVTALLAAGYDDRSHPSLPLIVQSNGGPSTLARRPGTALPSIGARAIAEPRTTAGEFWQSVTSGAQHARSLVPGVTRIWLDGRVDGALDKSVPQVGAPAAWQAGFTGQGVRTAVLDSGIDATHPDLTDAVEQAVDFTGSASGATDRAGHGTHVASIITGSGSASGSRYKGVAPDTRLLIGKVLDDTGHGTDSSVIAGMQWATEQGARVVNLSLSSCPGDGLDPMSLALNSLTASSGALFVVAAGNDGRRGGKVSNPGAADAALTVGAVDHGDKLADFSSQGPRVGDNAAKPELTAPGVAITAARATGTAPDQPADQRYTAKSGTSMATPHVAGAAALLAQQHPDWRADRLKAALVETAAPTADTSVYAQGAGRLDVPRAITQDVYATQSTVNLYAKWGRTEPVAKTVTYRNDGAEPIRLDLRVDGDAAAVTTLGTDRITMPAHGSADVVLSANPSGAGGAHGGTLLATGPAGPTGPAIRVPVSAYAEGEMHDLTLDVRDRDGAPFAAGALWIADLDTGKPYETTRRGDARVVRLPKGRYTVGAMISTDSGANGRSWTLAGIPELNLTADTEIALDARLAKPATVTVDNPAARLVVRRLGVNQTIAGRRVDGDITVQDPDIGLYALATPTTSRPYSLVMRAFFGADKVDYDLTLPKDGGIPQDPSFQVRTRDLAAVQVRLRSQGRAQEGSHSRLSSLDGDPSMSGWFHAVRFPEVRTEYLSAGPRVAWQGVLSADGNYRSEIGPVTAYTPGRNPAETWNGGVLAPVVDALRCGDGLYGEYRPFSASAPGHRGFASDGEWTGRLALSTGGRELSTTQDLDYPELTGMSAERADYALRLTATRPDTDAASTSVAAEWTFASARPTGPTGCVPHANGLLATRIDGDFDQDGHAPANRPFVLRIGVEGAGADAPKVRSFTAEASYDGGTTWHMLTALPIGGAKYVAIVPPIAPGTGDGAVALRTTVRDADGNGQAQTITRAYAFARP
ncbi:S8 family serine peptidase [Embleya sp. NBC_00896]|uniref:S8 family serine peptidase n=1 Tax=Embleya sp. NBC_00896 TaxID=2975961 RepID=UPI002F90E635|nr:S8 family serine peptidase [Embleya sp. NBC_00896]